MIEIIETIIKFLKELNNYLLCNGINILSIISALLITSGIKHKVYKNAVIYTERTKDIMNLITNLIISILVTVALFWGNWNIGWIIKTITLSFACSIGLFALVKAIIKIIRGVKK